MSIDEVRKNLGEPTYVQRQNTKEGKSIGWKYAYYFIWQDEQLVKSTDKYLAVYFGVDRKAEKISTSIKELRMKNWGEDFYIESIDEYNAKHGNK